MAKQLHARAVGIPAGYPTQMTPKRLLLNPCSQLPTNGSLKHKQSKSKFFQALMRPYALTSACMYGNSHLTTLGDVSDKLEKVVKVAETLTRKLSSGAKFLKVGGREKIFRYNFSVKEGEKLLKATRCCLSTTAGPIAGVLFISTERVAFCSQRLIALSSPTGEFIRIPYKVSIPVGNIMRANESENMNEPSQKYIEIVTVDDFDFWFMGLLSCRRTLKYLHQAICQDH